MKPGDPSRAMLFNLLKRTLVAHIRLDAADVFDDELYDYRESEIKLCLGMLDALLSKSQSAHTFLEQCLDDAWDAAITTV